MRKVNREWKYSGRMSIVTADIFFGCVSWQAGSYFPKQGLNLCPLQWKHGV